MNHGTTVTSMGDSKKWHQYQNIIFTPEHKLTAEGLAAANICGIEPHELQSKQQLTEQTERQRQLKILMVGQ